MQRDGNVHASRWCAGCHDPVPFFSGAFESARFDDPDYDIGKDPMAGAGITCTSRFSNVLFASPCCVPVSRSPPRVTRFAIHSLRISLRTVRTFAPFKSCWAIGTSAPP